MLTPEQEKWVSHLNTTGVVQVFPYDEKAPEKFEQIKSQIQSVLGDVEVLHRGASSLGISGQREIDVYIPITPEEIDEYTPIMEAIFGKPKSIYPLERTKFLAKIEGTTIEIMLTNKEHQNWVNGERFYNYLKENPEALERYIKLKEECAGLNCQEYYRRKIEFINEILGNMKILIFIEGTILMHKNGKGIPREEIVKQVEEKETSVKDYSSYIFIGNAGEKIKKWEDDGATIVYITSRKELKEIKMIRNVLKRYNFPDCDLVFRRKWESYADVAERVMPDILIEDDCESIGGKAEMTYTNIKDELKIKIKSVVIKEFGGIDDLSDKVSML